MIDHRLTVRHPDSCRLDNSDLKEVDLDWPLEELAGKPGRCDVAEVSPYWFSTSHLCQYLK